MALMAPSSNGGAVIGYRPVTMTPTQANQYIATRLGVATVPAPGTAVISRPVAPAPVAPAIYRPPVAPVTALPQPGLPARSVSPTGVYNLGSYGGPARPLAPIVAQATTLYPPMPVTPVAHPVSVISGQPIQTSIFQPMHSPDNISAASYNTDSSGAPVQPSSPVNINATFGAQGTAPSGMILGLDPNTFWLLLLVVAAVILWGASA